MLQHVAFGLAVAFAWLALLNLCATLWFFVCAPVVARRMGVSGRMALALRLAPGVISIAAVAVIVVPAFVWFEPVRAVGPVERFGLGGGALAIAGAVLLALAMRRGARAVARTRRAMRTVTVGARRTGMTRSGVPILLTDSPVPAMVLDGIVRPRLYVSRSVQSVLTDEELELAIAHELAHHAALDNAKRRLLAFVPDTVGGSAAARDLEARWRSEAELAADARAAGQHASGAVTLASALVKVARLRAGHSPLDLDRAAFHDGRPVAERIHRLLADMPAAANPQPPLRAIAAVVALGGLIALAAAPDMLAVVHQVTEFLVHLG